MVVDIRYWELVPACFIHVHPYCQYETMNKHIYKDKRKDREGQY